jgi:hypothetical protein
VGFTPTVVKVEARCDADHSRYEHGVVSPRQPTANPFSETVTMNMFVEAFLRKASYEAEGQFFENIIWVALSSSLGLLISVVTVAGGKWFF